MLRRLKPLLRPFVPEMIVRVNRDRARMRENERNRNRTTRSIFESVYSENKWGGEGMADGSGSGSGRKAAIPYVNFVNQFLIDHPDVLTIADIGCGDFRVGGDITVNDGQMYIGVEIVEPLVAHLEKNYADKRHRFVCLDAAKEDLPPADLYLVRQVLQHLCNDEVAAILAKLARARYALVTEHHPAPERLTAYNMDKPTGPDVRLYDGSGIYPDKPPFSYDRAQIVLEYPPERPLVHQGERLVTYLLD